MKPQLTTEPAKNVYPEISVYTEMPDTNVSEPVRGRVFYDAGCSLCQGALDRFGRIFTPRGFVFEPLQQAVRSGEFDLPAEEFHREIKLLDASGRWHGGADAWIELFNRVWYLRPIGFLAALPGVHTPAHTVYRRIASNRHCMNGACTAGQASSRSPDGWSNTTRVNTIPTNRSTPAPSEPQQTGRMPVLRRKGTQP